MRHLATVLALAFLACGADPGPQPKDSGDAAGGDAVYADTRAQCDAAPEEWKVCRLALCEWYSCYYVCPDLPEGPCIVRLDQDWDCTWSLGAWSDACPM